MFDGCPRDVPRTPDRRPTDVRRTSGGRPTDGRPSDFRRTSDGRQGVQPGRTYCRELELCDPPRHAIGCKLFMSGMGNFILSEQLTSSTRMSTPVVKLTLSKWIHGLCHSLMIPNRSENTRIEKIILRYGLKQFFTVQFFTIFSKL